MARSASYRTGRIPTINPATGRSVGYSKRYEEMKPSGKTNIWEFPSMKHSDANVQVDFIVPSTRNKIKRIGDFAFRNRMGEALGFFSHLFGGGTQIAGYGNYRLEGKNIAEPVGIIKTSTCMETWRKWDVTVKKWIMQKKEAWGQDSLMLSINGKSFFI